ncbi:MAG: response regulator [Dehalococcoidia bacterium]
MTSRTHPVRILMADDDPDDQMLTREALAESQLAIDLECVEDGEELINYLRDCVRSARRRNFSLPDLILLDLNMPKKDGREALLEIKSDPDLMRIPVVVLTTSHVEEDILRSYNLGVSGFIVKPVTLEQQVQVMQTLVQYWFQVVEMPYESSRV